MQSGVITALQVQQRDKERVNVFLDGEYAFSLAITEAALLKKGQTLSAAEIETLRHDDAIKRAVDRAARFLAYRPRSTAEIRDNLAKHETPAAVIEAALDRLESLGYLDDQAFARFWVENRQTFKPRGPMALRHELRQKGVADNVIDTVLADIDSDNAAYRAAEARVRRLRGLDERTFQQKMGGYLQRRGFDYATSRTVIARLVEELAVDDPGYFAADGESE